MDNPFPIWFIQSLSEWMSQHKKELRTMETVLSSSSSSSFHPLFRNKVKKISNVKGICKLGKKFVQCSSSSSSSKSIIGNGFCRRDFIFLGASSSVLTLFPSSGSAADEEFKMARFADDINGYSYMYPVEMPSKKSSFKWAESRKPERYSSAAPLSPDARQRIVSERVDFIDNIIISVSIGPPNPQFLKSTDKSTWRAKDVADSVLADKSALRVTSSQRMAESSVLDAHASEIDGETYWFYEYLIRKSPTIDVSDLNLYRHYVASTYERDGFLYSLNASTLGKQWDVIRKLFGHSFWESGSMFFADMRVYNLLQMGPYLEKTIASFRLLPPTENYVPPFKDPWRFW